MPRNWEIQVEKARAGSLSLWQLRRIVEKLGRAEITELISQQRVALCDRLDHLERDQFEAMFYCDGWRVRDVLGHLVSIVALPMWKFAALTPTGVHRRFDRNAKEFRGGATLPN